MTKLKEHMAKNDISNVALAAKTGLGEKTIRRAKEGEVINKSTKKLIASALEVTVEDIFESDSITVMTAEASA
jgi:DNA-binding Xre family transcriptional regulator